MLIVVVVLLFVVSTGIGQKSNQTPQRWEYKIVMGSVDDAQLNELGAAGWELTAVGVVNNNNSSFYFKRAK